MILNNYKRNGFFKKLFYSLFVVVISYVFLFSIVTPQLQDNSTYYKLRSYCYYILQQIKLIKQVQTNENRIGKKSILCFGDSITAGEGILNDKSYPFILSSLLNCMVIQVGQSGATTLDALKKIDQIISKNPSIVVIQFGGNDIARGFHNEIVYENIKKMITLIHNKSPFAHIIYIGNTKNDISEFLLKKQSNVYYVSFFSTYTQSEIFIDPVTGHPNERGHEKIAEMIADVILDNDLLFGEKGSAF